MSKLISKEVSIGDVSFEKHDNEYIVFIYNTYNAYGGAALSPEEFDTFIQHLCALRDH